MIGWNSIRSSSYSWLRIAAPLILGSSPLRVHAQAQSSAPFAYPGMPTTPYGPDWQSYYQVTDPLPNVTWTVPRSFAGSVSVNRENHPDNTLFFCAFERVDGSLTAADGERTDEPWLIWLNGGPGSSSMYGAFHELGPIRIGFNNQSSQNPWSWHNLTDIFFVDQPVGTGFSTADAQGFVADEDQMGGDFAQFLTNLVAIFPSLKNRPFYLAGESYAGTYIPYISKTLFGMANPPVKPAKIAIGDGAIGTTAAFEEFGIMAILDTFPQLINFDPKVYAYFAEQFTLCGLNLTFSYPETRGHFPPLKSYGTGSGRNRVKYAPKKLKELSLLFSHAERQGYDLPRMALERRQDNKYPVPALTGKINEWYECWLVEEVLDFANNYTTPWQSSVNIYDMSDALNPPAPDDPVGFLNNPAVITALHAPKKTFILSIEYPFASGLQGGNPYNDPSPEPMTFFNDLAKNVTIVLYSGNNDALVSHRGTELVIQNTTFGGIQGFTKRPETRFTDDEGNFAGIIHQERNITYALFKGAGHMVPAGQPEAAFVFLREFILGSNTTGLVQSNGTVIGGEAPAFFSGIIQDTDVYEGSYSTTATKTWPSSAWSAWDAFVATRTFAVDAVSNSTRAASNRNGKGNNGTGSTVHDRTSAMTSITWALALLLGSFML